MDLSLLHLLRCPVTRSGLQIQVISKSRKQFQGKEREIIHEGILFAERDWFYPVINGVPRLIVEAFEDYADFFETHLHDYKIRINTLKQNYTELISYVVNKNRRTKESFSQDWNHYRITLLPGKSPRSELFQISQLPSWVFFLPVILKPNVSEVVILIEL